MWTRLSQNSSADTADLGLRSAEAVDAGVRTPTRVEYVVEPQPAFTRHVGVVPADARLTAASEAGGFREAGLTDVWSWTATSVQTRETKSARLGGVAAHPSESYSGARRFVARVTRLTVHLHSARGTRLFRLATLTLPAPQSGAAV